MIVDSKNSTNLASYVQEIFGCFTFHFLLQKQISTHQLNNPMPFATWMTRKKIRKLLSIPYSILLKHNKFQSFGTEEKTKFRRKNACISLFTVTANKMLLLDGVYTVLHTITCHKYRRMFSVCFVYLFVGSHLLQITIKAFYISTSFHIHWIH